MLNPVKKSFTQLKAEFLPVKKKTNISNRLIGLDILKIISAFLVVFYHFSFTRLNYGFSSEFTGLYIPNFNRILMSFCACSVPLFFIINGAFMFSKHRSIANVYSRAVKIAVLILVWHFFDFPKWFFQTIIVLYILFPIFQFLKDRYMLLYKLICVSVFIMPFLYNYIVLVLNLTGITDFPRTGMFTLYSILYFLLGPTLIKKKVKKRYSVLISAIGLFLLVLECTCYTNLQNVMFDGVNASFPTIGALFLSVGIFLLLKDISVSDCFSKTFAFLGSGAIYIYLWHLYLLNLLIKINGLYSIGTVLCLLVSAATCIICIIIGEILKRIPILCFFVKI